MSQNHLTALAFEQGIGQGTGPAGQGIDVGSNSLHGSRNNIMPFARSNIFLVFNSMETALVEPFAAAVHGLARRVAGLHIQRRSQQLRGGGQLLVFPALA